jgi:hypothetical protein
MGIFDLPAPLFAWFDNLLGELMPPAARLAIWGIIGAAVSMGLYWLISPQQAIKQTQAKSLEARHALDSYEGEFAGAWPQMREMLRLALTQVGIVTLPAVIASLPVLCLLVWLSTAYGYHFPASGASIKIRSFPEQLQARWIAGAKTDTKRRSQAQIPRIELFNDQNREARVITLPVPIPSVHKHQWWNILFGSPAGYLPDNSKINSVEINLPPQEFLSFGPSWLRGWEFLFLIVLLVTSIIIKVVFRIK